MGLFRPYSRPGDADAAQPQDKAITDESTGKGAPTLSRREAEQARRERLHPTLSKAERRKRERRLSRERQDKSFADKESQPARVLLRNYVDSRWTFSEFSWPLLFVTMAAFLASAWWPPLAIYSSYGIYGVLLAVMLEVAYLWMGFKRMLAERYPDAPRKGMVMYMASRMVTMRRFRRPPAAVVRGTVI